MWPIVYMAWPISHAARCLSTSFSLLCHWLLQLPIVLLLSIRLSFYETKDLYRTQSAICNSIVSWSSQHSEFGHSLLCSVWLLSQLLNQLSDDWIIKGFSDVVPCKHLLHCGTVFFSRFCQTNSTNSDVINGWVDIQIDGYIDGWMVDGWIWSWPTPISGRWFSCNLSWPFLHDPLITSAKYLLIEELINLS